MGAVVFGTLFDDSLATRLAAQVGAELTFFEGTSIVASSMRQADRSALAEWIRHPSLGHGTLDIRLPLTSGTSTLAGPKPCGETKDDNCNGSPCAATCTGDACVSHDASGNCVDRLQVPVPRLSEPAWLSFHRGYLTAVEGGLTILKPHARGCK